MLFHLDFYVMINSYSKKRNIKIVQHQNSATSRALFHVSACIFTFQLAFSCFGSHFSVSEIFLSLFMKTSKQPNIKTAQHQNSANIQGPQGPILISYQIKNYFDVALFPCCVKILKRLTSKQRNIKIVQLNSKIVQSKQRNFKIVQHPKSATLKYRNVEILQCRKSAISKKCNVDNALFQRCPISMLRYFNVSLFRHCTMLTLRFFNIAISQH